MKIKGKSWCVGKEWKMGKHTHTHNFLLLLLVAFLSPFSFTYAQIHPLSDQYMMNFFQLNPATAGVVTLDPLVVNVRQPMFRWGDYRLPNSQSITFQSKLVKEKTYFNPRGFLNRGRNAFGKVGFGAGMFNYSYGNINQWGIHLDYAYHIFLGEGRMSFGLAPVLIFFRANFPDGSLIFHDNPDDILDQMEDPFKRSFLDFNAGIHYYSTTLTAGFSCLQLLNSRIHINGEYGFPGSVNSGDPINPDLSRTFYGYGGYAFTLNRNLRIEPFLMLKYNQNQTSRFRADLSASVYLFDSFQGGLTYKLLEGGAAFFGIRYNQFQLRYQFDFPLNGITPASFMAHMIQIGFDPGIMIN